MLGAAIAYNLKKLMKWGERKRISVCKQIEIQALLTKESSLSTIFMLMHYILHYNTLNIFQPLELSIKDTTENNLPEFL